MWRQPFPGPGLAVRIIGEVTPAKVAMLQQADAIGEELRKAELERDIERSAVLPDMRSVGVMGDERTYAHPIIVRAVTSEDAMTADWARLPYDVMEAMSSRIINEVAGVNRVAYDITSKPLAQSSGSRRTHPNERASASESSTPVRYRREAIAHWRAGGEQWLDLTERPRAAFHAMTEGTKEDWDKIATSARSSWPPGSRIGSSPSCASWAATTAASRSIAWSTRCRRRRALSAPT